MNHTEIGGKEFRRIEIGDYNYFVSADCEAYSLPYVDKRGNSRGIRKLKTNYRKGGYLAFQIVVNGRIRPILAHRAVAMAFIPNIESKPDINHKNGIKTDNRIENLEWCTKSENIKHSFLIGTNVSRKGEAHHKRKLSDKDVIEIRRLACDNWVKDLAFKFSVSVSNTSKIIHRKTWQHI